jgi:hypothetical protein
MIMAVELLKNRGLHGINGRKYGQTKAVFHTAKLSLKNPQNVLFEV